MDGVLLPTNILPQADKNEVLVGVEIFFGVVGVIGNGIVLVTIIYSKCLHTLTNYLILNLSVADAFVSLGAILNMWLIYNKLNWDTTTPSCYTEDSLDYYIEIQIYSAIHRSLSAASPLCLLLVTVELYVGIVHPLRHGSLLSSRRLVALLLLVWVIPFCIEVPTGLYFILIYQKNNCVPSFAEDEPWIIGLPCLSLAVTVLLPAVAMVWMYGVILRNLSRNALILEVQGIQGPPQELHQAHRKVANMLILVTVAFIVLIIPCRVIYITTVATFTPTTAQPVVQQQVVLILAVLNSSINPVLYGFKYAKFRRALISMLCWCKQGASNNVVSLDDTRERDTRTTRA